MAESDDDIFSVAPNMADASALVSKWLEDSEEENDADSAPISASITSQTMLSRVDGVGLGAEDLNDLVAQRRLDPTERKIKYRMEASAKWKEDREKQALALAKRIEDDVLDEDSRSAQLSKKRNRVFSKNAIVEMHANSKKKLKTKEVPVSDSQATVTIEHVQQTEKEVVFDFSSSHTPSTSDETIQKKPSEEQKPKPSKSPNHKSSQKDKHSKHKHHGQKSKKGASSK
jgi:hypothetical protein